MTEFPKFLEHNEKQRIAAGLIDEELFRRIDVNQSGYISRYEFITFLLQKSAARAPNFRKIPPQDCNPVSPLT